MFIPALVFAVVVAFAAAPVAIPTIIVFIAVAVVPVMAIVPIASSTVTTIAVLVAESEGVSVILAESRHTRGHNQCSVVAVRTSSVVIGPPRLKTLIVGLVIVAARVCIRYAAPCRQRDRNDEARQEEHRSQDRLPAIVLHNNS